MMIDKFKQLWFWITIPYEKYKARKQFKQHMKELRKKDPYIYK